MSNSVTRVRTCPIPGIKQVWPAEIISVGKPKVTKKKTPTTEQLYGPHAMTGVDYVHKTFKYTGKGVKGMELTLNQEMHVVNMSLGGGANPTAVLADKLIAHGMAVVAAALTMATMEWQWWLLP
ncbi:hypothetical protein BGZ81_011695 [Podila clonocystis]|nr:hypothetical protein BGZ81_011695 [Podila clonocystis]